MAINDALPLKAARRDAVAKLKSFWGFESELQTNPMPFHLDSLWGAKLMSLTACAMDWGRNKILRVGKNSGSILSRL